MSVIRDGILTLLSLGPAYGLQLRNELDARLQRPQSTNVGQIYSTLDRLCAADLVEQSAHTPDGLPLYTLTPAGEQEAALWLRKPRIDQANRWDAMVSQLMIARSIPNHSSHGLVQAFRAYWNACLAVAQESFAHSVFERTSVIGRRVTGTQCTGMARSHLRDRRHRVANDG